MINMHWYTYIYISYHIMTFYYIATYNSHIYQSTLKSILKLSTNSRHENPMLPSTTPPQGPIPPASWPHPKRVDVQRQPHRCRCWGSRSSAEPLVKCYGLIILWMEEIRKTTLDGWNPINHGINHQPVQDSFHPQYGFHKLRICLNKLRRWQPWQQWQWSVR